MRMLKTIVPALIALVVLMTGAPAVAAQDTDPAMPEMDIEGLEKMYGQFPEDPGTWLYHGLTHLRAGNTAAADASETSCSPDRPPKMIPTRNFFTQR